MTPPIRKRPINLLFICHDGQLYGSQRSLKLLIEHLPVEEFRIFVSFARGGPLMEILSEMPHVKVFNHERLQGAKHSKRKPLQQLGDGLGLLLNIGRILPLIQIIQDHRIDVVHSNSLISLEGAIAAKLAGVPHVWHVREIFDADNPKFNPVFGKRGMQTLVDKFSSRVICISDYVARQFDPVRSTRPDKYPVIFNAVNATPPEKSSRPASDLPIRLLYLGRISEGKQFHLLVDALQQIQPAKDGAFPYQLTVLGEFIDPDYEARIQKSITDSHLAEIIHFEGFQEDITPYLREADVLVSTSTAEAFGRSLIEAMNAGLAVIAPRYGAALEIVTEDETGWFYPPDSAKGLANLLNTLADNPEQVAQAAKNGQVVVDQRFSVETQIKAMAAIYRALARKSSPVMKEVPVALH